MLRNINHNHCDKTVFLNDIIQIVEGIASGWESQFECHIGSETLLGADLAFKSIDIVRLIAAIQSKYNKYEFPFQELFVPKGRPIKDLHIYELANFLHMHINHR